MELGILYHWSPAQRFDDVYREGLRPHSTPTVCVGTTLPYICLSPTPSAAWGLSGAMEWVSDIDEWDLWQVRLSEGDQVSVRPEFGPRVEEIKVYGSLPADRLWWAARRISTPANTCTDRPAVKKATGARRR